MSEVTKSISIKGMHCASCVRLIEKAVGKIEGVNSCVVNLVTEKATVKYDSQKVNDQTISAAVSSVGYQVMEEEKSDDEDNCYPPPLSHTENIPQPSFQTKQTFN